MPGALSYLSTATTSHPSLCALIITSFPSSPDPNNIIFFIFNLPRRYKIIFFIILLFDINTVKIYYNKIYYAIMFFLFLIFLEGYYGSKSKKFY